MVPKFASCECVKLFHDNKKYKVIGIHPLGVNSEGLTWIYILKSQKEKRTKRVKEYMIEKNWSIKNK